MIELTDAEYGLAANLIAPSPLTVEARAVVCGSNPGWVFVDSATDPRSVLVWVQGMEGLYLIGRDSPQDAVRKVREVVWDTVAARLRRTGISSVEISATDPKYYAAIEQAFSDRNLSYADQWIYRNPSDGRLTVASGSARPLSSVDITDTDDDLVNVKSTIEQFWGSTEEFSKRGLGYGVVESGKVVALCLSGLVDGSIHTVDIRTAEPFRRRGHAQSAASHFIAECVAKNSIVQWDCMATNEASWRLAEKLGFERIAEYRCYWFDI